MFEDRHNSFSIWKQRLIAFVAVLVAGVVFYPKNADASCGDYVLMQEHPGRGNASQLSSEHPEGQRGFPICSGPGCRERREAPASPPTRITLDEHSWGLPAKLVDQAPESCLFGNRSSEPAVAISLATGIFRPPRSVAAINTSCGLN